MASQDHRSLTGASRIPLVDSKSGFLIDAQFGTTTVKSLLDTSISDSKVECKSLNKDTACLADGSQEPLKGTVGTITTPTEVQVTISSKNGLMKVVPDGVLGLGPKSVLPLKSFSISHNGTDSNNSFVTIDSVDEKFIKDNHLVSEKSDVVDGRWTIASHAVQFDSDDAFRPCSSDSEACRIEVDSGSRTIGIPRSLGFAANYLKQCPQMPPLGIENYRRDYAFLNEMGLTEVCTEETEDKRILGQPFLSRYYTHFDLEHQQLTVYCKEGITCEAHELQAIAPPPSPRTSAPTPAPKHYTSTDDTSNEQSSSSSGRVPVLMIILIIKAILLSLWYIVDFKRREKQAAQAREEQQEPPYHQQQPSTTPQKPLGN